jgi:hypothetical protein
MCATHGRTGGPVPSLNAGRVRGAGFRDPVNRTTLLRRHSGDEVVNIPPVICNIVPMV